MPRPKKATTAQGAAGSNGTKGPNKTQAVTAALNELGKKAQPGDIQKFVRDNFGMELSKSLISNYKHTIVKKKGKGKKGRSKAGAAEGQGTAVGKAGGSERTRVSFQDLETVHDLKKRLGSDGLRALINIVG